MAWNARGNVGCETSVITMQLPKVLLMVVFLIHRTTARDPGTNKDPCHNYLVLNAAWRSTELENDGALNHKHCDRGFNGEWYRFQIPAGTSMPTHPPPSMNRCGTEAPMWMRGNHPTAADGEVTRQACALFDTDPCRWSTSIQVKSCGSFYVYKLPAAPACNLAYCAEPTGCSPDLCDSKATCEGSKTGPICTCPAGYEGDGESAGTGCTDIGGCSLGLCGQGATCRDVDERVICTCPPGTTGNPFVMCTDIDGCSPSPCGQDATCQDVAAPGTGAICSCPPGYTGDPFVRCTGIDACSPSPCGQDATCRDDAGRAICTCPRGYTGNPLDSCIPGIDACSPSPCGHGATCRDDAGRVICACPRGYTGNPLVSCTAIETCPEGYDETQIPGKCLRFYLDRPQSYSQAKRACEGEDGHIFLLKNEEGVKQVKNLLADRRSQLPRRLVSRLRNRGVWIGLTESGGGGSGWMWEDGRPLALTTESFTDWADGQPTGGRRGGRGGRGGRCVLMSAKHGFKWAVSSCVYRSAFICEAN
ncbi:sushi, nidogen and EGF-like domain-containing protein 1 isoform X1 [Branchiostoma lanceolatum]|uniref:sushi, nidogen and EGF-like domain-containing protein 1 isoform X1 n=2 Tax=Branchiostoma lanceolatum TaxID=7740 RepID=UPI003453EA70